MAKLGICRSMKIASMSAFLALSMAACGSAPQPAAQEAPAQETQQETQASQANSAQVEEEKATAQKFIEAYDARPGVSPLEVGDAFDPQDASSQYHRDTYDQAAFKDSYGVRCTTGDVTADIISFKNGDGYGIAVTATGPTQSINGFYRDVITVLDPNVDQQNVSIAINDAASGFGDGKVEGTTLAQTALNVSGNSAAMTILSGSYPVAESATTQPAEPEAEEPTGDNGYVDAIAAVRAYGEAMYPYGFKLHSTLGVESAVQPDPNEWVFQIKCDVTNEYGATAKDQTCSAFVDLVDGTWQVSAFSVD